MGFIKEAWDILWKLVRGRSIQDQRDMEQIYRDRIKFLKEELAERTAEIAELKKNHPSGGKEYDVWQAQLDDLYLQLYLAEKQKLEMKGMILFYDELLTRIELKYKK
jgi:hypothetical protein